MIRKNLMQDFNPGKNVCECRPTCELVCVLGSLSWGHSQTPHHSGRGHPTGNNSTWPCTPGFTLYSDVPITQLNCNSKHTPVCSVISPGQCIVRYFYCTGQLIVELYHSTILNDYFQRTKTSPLYIVLYNKLQCIFTIPLYCPIASRVCKLLCCIAANPGTP